MDGHHAAPGRRQNPAYRLTHRHHLLKTFARGCDLISGPIDSQQVPADPVESQLYPSLAEGVPIGRAFDQACLQVSLAGLSGDDTPDLFVRGGLDPNDLVFAG